MNTMRSSIQQYFREKLPHLAGGGRIDAAQDIYAARQLEYVYAKTYDVVYPELPMGEGQVVKFDPYVPRGAETAVYNTVDANGMAAILDTYDSASVPSVSMSGKQTVLVIKHQGLKYGYSVQDLEAASFANTKLDSSLANATKRGHVQRRDLIGWFGDAARGLFGLMTYPNTTQTLAPLNIALTSRLWADKTAQEILKDFATLINTPRLLSLGAETVNVVYLPEQIVADLKARYLNTANASNQSIYQSIVDNFPGVSFKSAFQLDAAQHASVSQFAGLNVAVAFNDNVDKISFVVPIVFDQMPPQYEGFMTNVYTRASTGGIKCPYPISVSILLGF